jgi:hypothetical protein
MTKKLNLIDRVLEQIKKDVESQDLMALDELLRFVPVKYLTGYLPEEDDDE